MLISRVAYRANVPCVDFETALSFSQGFVVCAFT